jgi:hypothetical protein
VSIPCRCIPAVGARTCTIIRLPTIPRAWHLGNTADTHTVDAIAIWRVQTTVRHTHLSLTYQALHPTPGISATSTHRNTSSGTAPSANIYLSPATTAPPPATPPQQTPYSPPPNSALSPHALLGHPPNSRHAFKRHLNGIVCTEHRQEQQHNVVGVGCAACMREEGGSCRHRGYRPPRRR